MTTTVRSILAGTAETEPRRSRVSGLTADLLVITTGALIWLFAEAVRLRMRWPVYLALTLTTPFAFVFALFLLRREQVLART